MICSKCQQRTDCIPAALAAKDSSMYALLERLEKCDRYTQKQEAPAPKQRSSMPRLKMLFTRHFA